MGVVDCGERMIKWRRLDRLAAYVETLEVVTFNPSETVKMLMLLLIDDGDVAPFSLPGLGPCP